MSQRTWETEEYKILTGWDRPLQYFFLVITYQETHPKLKKLGRNENPIAFSNLDLDNPAMQLGQIERKLDELNIEYPKVLFKDLFNDCQEDKGNYSYQYKPEEIEKRS